MQNVVRHFKMTMRFNLIIWTSFILTSCNLKEQKNTQSIKDTSYSHSDTTQFTIDKVEEPTNTDPYDSLARAYVDTFTLKGKRQWIMNHFLSEHRPSSPDSRFPAEFLCQASLCDGQRTRRYLSAFLFVRSTSSN